MSHWWNEKRDALLSALVFAMAFILYTQTLAPSVVGPFDDSLEIQYIVPRLGILHPTGYPLYTILGKLFTWLVPLNDAAFRLNLFSALCAALAVAFVYTIVRYLAAARAAAFLAAVTFAVGRTFWAQAVVAEVYAFQMLLVALLLWLTLRYAQHPTPRTLYALAFVMGLGLAHHRLMVLLYPAIALYIFLVHRARLRDGKTLGRAILFLLAPLTLYLYLPLRGAVGSADGTYQNTLAGFIEWVTASKYFAFITENPFDLVRDAAFYQTLFQDQFTLAGLALATLGIVGLWRRPREGVLILGALALQLAFAFNYRTADVEVHFLTTFLLGAMLLGAGTDALFSIANGRLPLFRSLATLLLCLIPIHLLNANFATNDLSRQWEVYDYGVEVLAQPFENDATVIGILGEMTLLRYFQEAYGLRPDVQTIAADKEPARLAAIANALQQNRAVYLTRALAGAPEKYSLSSVGPLIRVQPQPLTRAPALPRTLNADLGAVKLIGYDLKLPFDTVPRSQHAESGKSLRVTLYWQVNEPMTRDAFVSLKLLRADQRILGQTDQRPVRGAYPTRAWRVGEIIADTYDVPILFGATPSEYGIHVTLYDASSGEVLGQTELQKIALGAETRAPRRAAWQIEKVVEADFGAVMLVGYSRTHTPLRPGDTLPVTWLWRAGWQKPPDNLTLRFSLEDARGNLVASRDALLSIGYPPFQWQPQMFVRDWSTIRLPANLADGVYTLKLAVARENVLLGSTLLPFIPTVVNLGEVEIKNRARVMTAPNVEQTLEAVFDNKMKLLGYATQTSASPHRVQVTLYWRALAPMDTAYTVFVHLLDAENRLVVAGDAPPGLGDLPTTGWIENEYITDVHPLALDDVPPGTYHLEIGVYDPLTGARLKTSDGADHLRLTTLQLP
jgi:hypothetical protein